MKNNIYVLDLATTFTFRYQYLGTLIFTPDTIYFIATEKISTNQQTGFIKAMSLLLGTKGGIESLFNNDLKNFIQSENVDSIIQQLDRLVSEKKGSIRINKSEIVSFKLLSSSLDSSIIIRTEGEKYRFNIANVIRENKLSELESYLNSNMYFFK